MAESNGHASPPPRQQAPGICEAERRPSYSCSTGDGVAPEPEQPGTTGTESTFVEVNDFAAEYGDDAGPMNPEFMYGDSGGSGGNDGGGMDDKQELDPALFALDSVTNREEDPGGACQQERPHFEPWTGLPSDKRQTDGSSEMRGSHHHLAHEELVASLSSSSSSSLGSHNGRAGSPAKANPQAALPRHELLKMGIARPASAATTQCYEPLVTVHDAAEPSGHEPAAGERGTQPRECQCFQPVVFLVGDLETGQDQWPGQGVDVGLAALKEALGCAQDFLQCRRCRVRPEYMTVLSFLVDRLTDLCWNIATENRKCPGSGGGGPEGARGPTGKRLQLLLGHYEADSAREWAAVMEALTRLQLRNLYSLMDRMRGMAEVAHLSSICMRVELAQSRVAVLLQI